MFKVTIIAMAASVALTIAAVAPAAEFTGRTSVWSVPSSEQDTDGNGTGFMTTGEWQGTFGRARAFIIGDSGEWDGFSFCDFDAEGNPIAVPVELLAATWVLTFQNGDQLWFARASSPPSEFCFNFIETSLASELYFDVIGGTGEFAGATGAVVSRGLGGRELPNGVTVDTAAVEGQVFLAPGR